VIDVAAHMQKAAEPGALMVSETTAHYLPGGMESVGETRVEIDEITGVQWKPRVKVEAAALATPSL
jgi:hypothetical protein